MTTNLLSAPRRYRNSFGLSLILFFAISLSVMAQSASSVVPSRVAYKSSVRINGTGLSGVTNVNLVLFREV